MFAKVENKDGITLKDIREFVKKCEDLNENTSVLMNYHDRHAPVVKEIIADDNNIEIYNW